MAPVYGEMVLALIDFMKIGMQLKKTTHQIMNLI